MRERRFGGILKVTNRHKDRKKKINLNYVDELVLHVDIQCIVKGFTADTETLLFFSVGLPVLIFYVEMERLSFDNHNKLIAHMWK